MHVSSCVASLLPWAFTKHLVSLLLTVRAPHRGRREEKRGRGLNGGKSAAMTHHATQEMKERTRVLTANFGEHEIASCHRTFPYGSVLCGKPATSHDVTTTCFSLVFPPFDLYMI